VLSFVGECIQLHELEGQVTLYFTKLERRFLGRERQVLVRAALDTRSGTLVLEASDITEHPLSLDPLLIEGLEVREVAKILQEHLVSTGECEGTVVLTRTDSAGSWGVRCGPPDEVFIECLEIDSITGEIE
jgi:hypothetical protein